MLASIETTEGPQKLFCLFLSEDSPTSDVVGPSLCGVDMELGFTGSSALLSNGMAEEAWLTIADG